MNSNNYPWFEKQWTHLAGIPKEKFPHALIATGVNGIGKLDFCSSLSQLLLCDNPSNEIGCGECNPCKQYLAGSHGDFLSMNILEGKKSIGVDQVREMIHWVNLTKQSRQKKVLLIPQAQLMTNQASNALLKTLEEPPNDVVIILVAEQLKSLMPTIRSRCQLIPLSGPNQNTFDTWICDNSADWTCNSESMPENTGEIMPEKTAKNNDLLFCLSFQRPLKAKQLLCGKQLVQRKSIVDLLLSVIIQKKAPILVAADLFKLNNDDVFYWFQSLLFDFLYIHYKVEATKLINKDYMQKLKSVSGQLNILFLLDLQKQINNLNSFEKNALNPQLLLDSYIIKWSECLNNS